MKISICSQIKNRLYQFSKTFPKNIETLKNSRDIEWIIVDCESSDGLDQYLKEYLIQYDFLKYYRTINYNEDYSIPVAKNFAARLSSGDYLFNLDTDNFLDNIIDEIRSTDKGVHCSEYLKGTHGRIGMSREVFVKLGGYDENFYPAGVHDNDIMLRAKYLDYSFKDVPNITPAIYNNKDDTVKNFNKLNWEKMREYNEIIMLYNEKKKVLNPNLNNHKSCSFELNFKENIEKTNEF